MIKSNLQRFVSGGLLFLSVTIFGSMSVSAEQLRGTVSLDGSSTVFPISEAVAEEFLAVQPRVRVTVGASGTGGGFKKFLAGEIDINDASRPIKMKEVDKANEMGDLIEFGVTDQLFTRPSKRRTEEYVTGRFG